MADYSLLGLIVLLAGIVIIFVASVASSRHGESGETKVKGGGVIMVGPIPIIFGTDTRWLVVAIILAGLLLLLGLVSYWR